MAKQKYPPRPLTTTQANGTRIVRGDRALAEHLRWVDLARSRDAARGHQMSLLHVSEGGLLFATDGFRLHALYLPDQPDQESAALSGGAWEALWGNPNLRAYWVNEFERHDAYRVLARQSREVSPSGRGQQPTFTLPVNPRFLEEAVKWAGKDTTAYIQIYQDDDKSKPAVFEIVTEGRDGTKRLTVAMPFAKDKKSAEIEAQFPWRTEPEPEED